MNGYIKPKKKRENGIQEPEKPKDEVNDYEYGVIYVLPKCPKCKSKNVKCNSTRPGKRYYKCRDCGINFKAVEIEDLK